jgi:Ti-type conjugative transfer relaxase TraA
LAIFYCQMSVVSRSTGRSAVAAAAYRSAETLLNERDGRVHVYESRAGIEHSEIILPDAVLGDSAFDGWAEDRSRLWNAAELAEKRNDARVAREFVVALPAELSGQGRIDLTRDFARLLSNRYGVAVDFAIHAPHPKGDVRNHHAHVLMTTRQVTRDGLGAKSFLEYANKDLVRLGLASTQTQLVHLRRSWEGLANERLAMQGFDIRIDHRSHAERGLEIEPTEHMGVSATNVERRGGKVDRGRIGEDAAVRNAELIAQKPDQVLSVITGEKSVFDRYDIARTLHRYINDDAQAYARAFASVMASPALVTLQAERVDAETGEIELARYSTRDMVDLEAGMIGAVRRMHADRFHDVDPQHVDHAIAVQDAAIRQSLSDQADTRDSRTPHPMAGPSHGPSSGLSHEQRRAIEHITGPERIAVVVGFAGAGKSTMLTAARHAWEARGYAVHGAALSGKAAEGLEASSGIESRTLASWDMSWQNGKRVLGRNDVFVIDEAGMVGSRQLARFVHEAETRGAKIVLVGDDEQLQAIGAGAPFRAIAEDIGHAELSDIRRQQVDWQRDASVAFASHRTQDGLAAYRDHGAIHFAPDHAATQAQIVADYLEDRVRRPDGSRVVMAHRRVDVRSINDAIRSGLQARGELAGGEKMVEVVPDGRPASGERDPIARNMSGVELIAGTGIDSQPGAFVYQTRDGKREFAAGDRLVFLENSRDLGVKNGMLGTVSAVGPDAIQVVPDGLRQTPGGATSVTIQVKDYQSFDHGYATTIHKNQGATVDRAFVLASATMDRHLTYVAMTRHRDDVQLYADADAFSRMGSGYRQGRQASHPSGGSTDQDTVLHTGRLVAHGAAPYGHDPDKRGSYFVTLENAKGEGQTVWGFDLERAMTEASPEPGDLIGLRREGSETIRLPTGEDVKRNSWSVLTSDELAYAGLADRLSRSGMKETTLDYGDRAGGAAGKFIAGTAPGPQNREPDGLSSDVRAFAERRGIADVFGIHSEIDVGPRGFDQDRNQLQSPFAESAGYRDILERGSKGRALGVDLSGAQDGRTEPDQSLGRRRSMFDGLKLKSGPASLSRDDAAGTPQGSRPALSNRPEPGGRETRQEDHDRLAGRAQRQSPFELAVDSYARAHAAVDRQIGQGLPVLVTQERMLDDAGEQLDRVRPGSSDLAKSALYYDPELSDAMNTLSGPERVRHLMAGMEEERQRLKDPDIRAERFLESWQALQEERHELLSDHGATRALGSLNDRIQRLVDTLEGDADVEAILDNRREALGIATSPRHNVPLSEELQRRLDPDRHDDRERSRDDDRDYER